MTSDEYLLNTLEKYVVNETAAKKAVDSIYPIIEKWGNGMIARCFYSGSIAKGTAISLSTDADVFISLTSTIADPLRNVYSSLYNAFNSNGYSPRKQNVSIGISVNGYKIDLVPGVRQSQYGYDHSLYKSKTDSWTKTNVEAHISLVANSTRKKEIKLIKIWCQLNNLAFPSLYIELLVIEALHYARVDAVAINMLNVFNYISANIITKSFYDPSNTNNKISDDLSDLEKIILKAAADRAIAAQSWTQVVW